MTELLRRLRRITAWAQPFVCGGPGRPLVAKALAALVAGVTLLVAGTLLGCWALLCFVARSMTDPLAPMALRRGAVTRHSGFSTLDYGRRR